MDFPGCPWAAQAVIAAVYDDTLGVRPAACISLKSSRALPASRPFPHATMAQLYENRLGFRSDCFM